MITHRDIAYIDIQIRNNIDKRYLNKITANIILNEIKKCEKENDSLALDCRFHCNCSCFLSKNSLCSAKFADDIVHGEISRSKKANLVKLRIKAYLIRYIKYNVLLLW